MSTAPQVRQFAGDFRLWEIGDGIKTPVIPAADDFTGNQPIETESCQFSYTPGDKTEVKSRRRDHRYGQPLVSENQPGTTKISILLREQPPLIVARILYGEGSSATLASGSVTDIAFVVKDKSFPLELPHRLLKGTPAPVVKHGTATLIEGADYSIDLRRGLIVVKADDVAIGDSVLLSYSYEAQVNLNVVGGTTPTKDYFIIGDMQDRRSTENGELRVPQVSMTVDGEIDWLSTEPMTVTLAGDVIVAPGEEAPYTFRTYRKTA